MSAHEKKGLKFEGFGVVLPGEPLTCVQASPVVLPNADALAIRPGVLTRHVARDTDQIAMAADAVRLALEKAGCSLDDVDLLVAAQAVLHQPIPANAPLILRKPGAVDGRHEGLDVNTTCLSFLNALDLVDMMIASGRVRRAVIVSSELASRGLPWHSDPVVAAHFGDAAVACVVTSGSTRVVARRFVLHPSGADTCHLASGGTALSPQKNPEAFEAGRWFHMDGKELFRTTFNHLPAFFESVLERAGWHRSELDWILPHQASPLALNRVSRMFAVDESKVWNICAQVGNTIAASLPLVLSRAVESGRVLDGHRVMLIGTSAGLGFGALALEWRG